jgi:hypothetical protein
VINAAMEKPNNPNFRRENDQGETGWVKKEFNLVFNGKKNKICMYLEEMRYLSVCTSGEKLF